MYPKLYFTPLQLFPVNNILLKNGVSYFILEAFLLLTLEDALHISVDGFLATFMVMLTEGLST